MTVTFYVAGAIAVLSTALMLTSVDVIHGLLYLVVSLLAVAVVFFTLGAPFMALLEVILYAGAIMVLFVFVVMMLNLGARARREEQRLLTRRGWVGPVILAAILLALLARALAVPSQAPPPAGAGPEAVGAALFGPYALGVELASLLLLAALVGAYHLGARGARASSNEPEVPGDRDPREPRPPPGLGAVRAGPRGSAGAT
jgi:NADH-quinone oxidoreductase subunit J